MKRRVLLASLLTIALCCCLVCGATYALFTSESKVDIVVSSGKVQLKANVENIQTWSLEDDYTLAGRTDKTFTQGGYVDYTDGSLTLSKLIPGDKVSFVIAGENLSNVKVQYRVIISCDQAYKLMEGIEITIDGNTYTLVDEDDIDDD